MDNLIDVISRLQEVFATVDSTSQEMKLPQIVTVGAQSAGKSSLIERFVGFDFLPRGTGIVTRMPLELNLCYCPADDVRRKQFGVDSEGEFAVFTNESDLPAITHFPEITEQIMRITSREAGEGKNVINKPIRLTIYSEHVIDLNLVDLPGLTNVAVLDQPHDIPEQIRYMVEQYVSNENSIILAVQPANNDIANSESMQLAKKYDQDGKRTIAVLTKLDLVDRGTDAREVLSGKTLAVKLGIIGVCNRSEADKEWTHEQTNEYEAVFLSQHYPDIRHYHGCNYLRVRLNEILTQHILTCLPSLEKRIYDKLQQNEKELDQLGETCDDPLRAASQVAQLFCSTYLAFSQQGGEIAKGNKLCSAAEITRIMHEELDAKLRNLDPIGKMTKAELLVRVRNEIGLMPHIFPSCRTFASVIRDHVPVYLKPSLRCAQKVHGEMMNIANKCEMKDMFSRFSRVKSFCLSTVRDILKHQLATTEAFIKSSMHHHQSYINTHFPGFDAEYEDLLKKIKELRHDDAMEARSCMAGEHDISHLVTPGGDSISPVEQAANLIASAIPTYNQILINVIGDTVAKAIVFNLIDRVNEELPIELNRRFLQPGVAANLFVESADTQHKRKVCHEKIEALTRACEVLEHMNRTII